MRRLSILVVVSLVAFAAALVAFSDPSRQGCLLDAPRDDSYSAVFEGPVRNDETEHVLIVEEEGRPVTGAKVCVNVEMVGMTGMAYSSEGRELAGGRYELPVQMPMPADWRAIVIVEEPDAGNPVGIPVAFKVVSG